MREQKKEEGKRKLEEVKMKKLEKTRKIESNSWCGTCKRVVKSIKLRCIFVVLKNSTRELACNKILRVVM